MPNLKNDITKCKHPNSRKTIALSKQLKKIASRQKKKTGHYVKQNIVAEKLLWFRNNLEKDAAVYTPEQVEDLILKYLSRFEDELQQIKLKHSTRFRNNRQHASREDIINLTKKRELEEFTTCGIEIPDLLNKNQLTVLREWNGELRFLQNINLRRINKKYLSSTQRNFTSNLVENSEIVEDTNNKINIDVN